MDAEFVMAVISRIVHVSTAIVLVGGSVFTLLVLMPSAGHIGDRERVALLAGVLSRWKRFVHIGILLFLVTGLYNYYLAIPLHRGDRLYHPLLGVKMLLALGVFFIASALVGRSASLEPMRQQRRKWLTILVVFAAVIVILSGFLKIRGVP